MFKLKVISSSARPGRIGPTLARWISEKAQNHGQFAVELLDLGEVNLPLMNEAALPEEQNYEHELTRWWSAQITEAEAFIFVTAEYNHSYPAPLKNALEYLVNEWEKKPAGIVSYSDGAFAGVRALAHLKADLLEMQVVSIYESVNVPNINDLISEEGNFAPNELILKSADRMLEQLVVWTRGMKVMRDTRE